MIMHSNYFPCFFFTENSLLELQQEINEVVKMGLILNYVCFVFALESWQTDNLHKDHG